MNTTTATADARTQADYVDMYDMIAALYNDLAMIRHHCGIDSDVYNNATKTAQAILTTWEETFIL